MKISPRFRISSLLSLLLICAAGFAWLRPFEPDVRLSNIRVEQRRDTLNGEVICVELVVSNRSANTIWLAANEHGLIPTAVMLTTTVTRNGEEQPVFIPYNIEERPKRKTWYRVPPRQMIELHTEVTEVTHADEFVMVFAVHDWRGRTADVRAPAITIAESPTGLTRKDGS